VIVLVHIRDDRRTDRLLLEHLFDRVEPLATLDEDVTAGLLGVRSDHNRVEKTLRLDGLGQVAREFLGERAKFFALLFGFVNQFAVDNSRIHW
jgi:hypothetical protein